MKFIDFCGRDAQQQFVLGAELLDPDSIQPGKPPPCIQTSFGDLYDYFEAGVAVAGDPATGGMAGIPTLGESGGITCPLPETPPVAPAPKAPGVPATPAGPVLPPAGLSGATDAVTIRSVPLAVV